MTQGPILHIFNWDRKFFFPYRALIRRYFQPGQHRFIVHGNPGADYEVAAADTVAYSRSFTNFPAISRAMAGADKVILHGLFDIRLYYILSPQPWLLRKCYWNIWGGDLYIHQAGFRGWRFRKDEFLRRWVIGRIGHVVSCVKGDYELARQWYGSKAQFHRCIMYPSNLFSGTPREQNHTGPVNIQVGNSADPSNNHMEVLEKLRDQHCQDFNLFVPLSYGNKTYAAAVIEAGIEMFGNRFFPMTEFMQLEQYLDFLEKIDIAIFAHRRQQGMGNLINLLGLGKKIFMRRDITTWTLFADLGIRVHDIEQMELTRLEDQVRRANQTRVSDYFTERRLCEQWAEIFAS